MMPTANGRASGWYVYGVVDGDIVLEPRVYGIGDPPARVDLVRRGDVAALVSEVDLGRPIGRPEDLQAHQQLLDAAVVDAPVLPFRFGAVLSSRQAVAEELLDAHRQEFSAALDALSQRVQYVVRARYHEGAILREVLQDSPEAARLAEEIRGADEMATRDLRIALGQVINESVAAKRDADTAAMVDALAGAVVATSERPPTHEFDAAHLAVLVDRGRQRRFERTVGRIADGWRERAAVRLLGPMAAYDFVVMTGTG